MGLHWHHFSGLALLVLFGVAVVVATVGRSSGHSSASAGYPPAIGGATAPTDYRQAWSDEFNSSSVDASKWNMMNNSTYGNSSHQDECYEPANITEGGGVAQITAKRQTVTCGGTNPDGGSRTYYFTSGFLTSRADGGSPDRYSFTQGYVEASIKLPKGNPYWGAFWLVGATGTPGWPDYGEFDVLEHSGIYPDSVTGTLHYACAGSSNCNTNSWHLLNLTNFNTSNARANKGTQLTSANYGSYSGVTSSQYVRYGMLWEANRITWYINGRPVRSFDGTNLVSYTSDVNGNVIGSTTEATVGGALPAPTTPFSTVFSYPHTIDLNLAIGGTQPAYDGYTGNETSTGYSDGNLAADLPGSMNVDYVRVYQYATPAPSPTPLPVPTPAPSAGTTTTPTSADSSTPGSTASGSTNPATTASGTAAKTAAAVAVTVLSLSTPSSSKPIPVSGTVSIQPVIPGGDVSVSVDGQASGSTINTKSLTNGTHVIAITENGIVKKQVISVHNSLPVATRNYLMVHRVASVSSGSGILLGLCGVWLVRGQIRRFAYRHA